MTLGAFVLFFAFVALAVCGPWLTPYDPLASDTTAALQPPSHAHWFGTDALGRDILSRIMVAARLDFGIAISAVFASFFVGSALGSIAGFHGGWADRVIGRISDTIMAFPLFVLAMGIVAALGNTVANIVLATAIINLPFYIRVSRAEVNVRRNMGYVEAARLAGNSDLRTLAVHVFPNVLPPMMAVRGPGPNRGRIAAYVKTRRRPQMNSATANSQIHDCAAASRVSALLTLGVEP